MKNRSLFVFIILSFVQSYTHSQTEVTKVERNYYGVGAGLGVILINSPDMIDYINTSYIMPSKLDDFGVAAEFFGFGTIPVSDSWDIKLEYAFLIKSYNVPASPLPDYNFSYNIHMPTLLLQKYFIGQGYILKFGGGGGYHLAQFSRNLVISNTQFNSDGIGIKIEAEGHTEFDEHLFGMIGLDIRGDFMSEFKDPSGAKLFIRAKGENARMNFFGVGLKFGLLYYF